MLQLEVPAISAMCRSSAESPSRAMLPSTPSAPAWASISPAPTRQAVVSPSVSAASGRRAPRSVPIAEAASGSAPRSGMSPMPIASKKSRCQPGRSWAR